MTAPWTIFRVSAAMRGNKVIYWLGRVPLIRRLVSDSLYNAAEGKLALTALLWVWRGVKAFAGKFLYLALMSVLPLLIAFDHVADAFSPKGFGIFCYLLLILSFVVGTLLQPKAVEPSQLKFTCVRMMAMDARRYQLWVGLGHHLSMFATFTPALMAASALFGQGALPGLLLSVELACARLAGEWLHVLLYHVSGKVLGANNVYIILMATFGLCGAYIPACIVPNEVDAAVLMPQAAMLHPVGVVLFLAFGLLSAVLLLRYPNYYRLVLDTSRPEQVSAELAKQKAGSAQFKDVQLKDSDLTAEGEYGSLSGWPYLQALFFRRHRRLLYKPVKIALAVVAVVTVIGIILLLIFRNAPEVAEVFDLTPRCLPYCVFFLYLMDSTVGGRICKAMFYNCDLAMLKYGWYRQPDVVLKNFTLRFRRLCGVNLLLSGAVCVMFTALVLCAGGRPPAGEYLIFLAALLCLGVFFAVHSLGMYYLFQPYTSDLQVKNPFFSIINWVVYMVCYLCIQIKSTPSWFALLVLVVTAAYSAVILLLVWKRAPRTFRIK